MSDLVVCPFSQTIPEMNDLRTCRGGGKCGRDGWVGPFGRCLTFKGLEQEEQFLKEDRQNRKPR